MQDGISQVQAAAKTTAAFVRSCLIWVPFKPGGLSSPKPSILFKTVQTISWTSEQAVFVDVRISEVANVVIHPPSLQSPEGRFKGQISAMRTSCMGFLSPRLDSF